MTVEVVDSGPERPRRGWAVGVAAALLLAVGAYRASRPDPAGEARPPDPVPSTPSPELRTAPPPPDPDSGQWALPPLTGATGLRIALGDVGLRVLDAGSGRVTPIALPALAETDPVAAIPGGWLAFQQPVCGTPVCDRPLYAVRGGRARFVARADRAALAPDARSVWVTGHSSRTAEPDLNPQWLEHRTLDGDRLARRVRLRPRERLLGITVRGPVTTTPARGGWAVVQRDRAGSDPATVVRHGYPLAVSRRTVAYLSDACREVSAERCALSELDVTTGAARGIATVGAPVGAAAYDPTGRYLAVAFDHRESADPPPAGAPAVAVYDTALLTELPTGLAYPPDAAALAWSANGWLVATHVSVDGRTGGTLQRLAVWRPGTSRARGLPAVEADGGPLLAVASS